MFSNLYRELCELKDRFTKIVNHISHFFIVYHIDMIAWRILVIFNWYVNSISLLWLSRDTYNT